ncbi:secretion protein [Mycobacterium sp. 1245852.3]|nr:secretion protein [Mycobacterium sp. 1245852.3]
MEHPETVDVDSDVGAGSVACQEFITQLGRNFQVIYEQANSHGQKVQSAGSNMASTDSAVGSSWA